VEKRKASPRPRAATLRDVAAAAGVSVWTASNTYSNPARVAEATRERVYAAARELSYAGPHPGARSLARGRSGTVAFVAPGDAALLLGDPAAALVARGLLTACDRAGYSLLLSGRSSEDAADGRVFFRTGESSDRRGPTIVVDGPAGAGSTGVNADVRGAGTALAAHLQELGHTDLAVLAWPGGRERLAGVAAGWSAPGPFRVFGVHGRRPETAPAGGDGSWPTPALGEALARAALSARPRPTAILGLSDTLALAALQAAHWMGLSVPRDVSIAGLDDLPGSDAVGLTSALIPYRPLGERAGDVLTAILAGEEAPRFADMPTALSIRRTTAPPPSAA
jgi:DNA-binding LacI/PurR family transcriptional regulator